MKKIVLVGLGLFMLSGFLPAKEMKVQTTAECFITSCGTLTCYLFPRDLTVNELLVVYDHLEENHCG
ncbi:hypothetical protein [Proteiniphilum sp.]|uniref:hypothetical protein n=1 Tax=Proteiniphilum sp. TaxID=1926877 RepID=UPI00331A16C0